MKGKELLALRDVVLYYIEDELKHFEESDRPQDHIYRSLAVLYVFLIKNKVIK